MNVELEWHQPGDDTGFFADDLWEILVAVDQDFVPPLSARKHIPNKNLKDAATWAGPLAYYDSVLTEHVVLARSEGEIVGVVSFIPDFDESQMAAWSPSCYVTTIAVRLMSRHHGIAHKMLDYLFEIPLERCQWITTRTWSTNDASIRLFTSWGMQEVVRIEDDRGPGIDSIYFARPFADTAHGTLPSVVPAG